MISPSDPWLTGVPPLPRFEVRLTPPNLDDWLSGNCGVPGIQHFETGRPGPHVLITALMHGNEIAGAIVLDELLRARLRPLRGKLTLGFLNLAAFARFDAAQPTASRFVDEDMNRLWDAAILEGTRESIELSRAREVRPIIDSADILLDLHSMLWPSEPLILSGPTAKGRHLARAIGIPPMAVADRGHSSGPRLIDYNGFAVEADPRIACLVEAGPHWEPATVVTARTAVMSLLKQTSLMSSPWADADIPVASKTEWRCAEVTEVVTATTSSFSFIRPFRGGEVIPERNTLIAVDGNKEIRTPHDGCLLVMPSLRPSRGHTAVRLASFLPE
jgi:predicted deacylase